MMKTAGVAIITTAAVAWCVGCSDSVEARRDVQLREGRIARDVSLSNVVEGRMQVEYRSSQSVKDCQNIQMEVRELWDVFIKQEAEGTRAVEVLIWPEDTTRSARSYSYSRDSETVPRWKEKAGFLSCE